MYCPLLANGNEFVRQFAAESFSFLLRKTDPTKLRSHLLELAKKIQENSHWRNLEKGMSHVFFEHVKGVKHSLHSRAPIYLNTLFDFLIDDVTEEQAGKKEKKN